MSKLQATATINFAKSKIKFSSLEPHIFRTYKNMLHDKNKRIHHKLSKFNGKGFPINYEKFMEKFIDKKRLANQRKKYLAHRQKSRAKKFASPKAFIQSKNHRNCRCGIITLGDHNFQQKLNEIIHHRFPKLDKVGASCLRQDLLKNYLKKFNKRHKYIKICAYAIHGDEQFLHAHAEFMGIPTHSKKGNLQLNFNKSLRLEMRNQKEIQAGKLPSNRVALHRFQQQEDPLILSTANKAFGVTLTRHGASKDDQEQHSLAVSESAKASSYASAASSSTSYLNSLNADFRASLSKSAAKSLKSRKRFLANSVSSTMISFDNSAYGGYASQLSKGLNPYLSGSASSGYWLDLAKGSQVMKFTKSKKIINNPLSYKASEQASKASSASSTNSLLVSQNSSLNDKNNSLSDNISNKKDTLNKNFKQNLLDLGLNKNDANYYYQQGGMPLNDGKHKPLIKCVIHQAHHLINYVKNQAKSIIKKAKQRAKEWTGINDNGQLAMQNYINDNNPEFINNPSQSEKAAGYRDAADLYGSDFVSAYNDTANLVHNNKVMQRQRQNQRGRYWGE